MKTTFTKSWQMRGYKFHTFANRMQTKKYIFFYRQRIKRRNWDAKYSHRNPKCKISLVGNDFNVMITSKKKEKFKKFKKPTKKKIKQKKPQTKKNFKIFNWIKRKKNFLNKTQNGDFFISTICQFQLNSFRIVQIRE